MEVTVVLTCVKSTVRLTVESGYNENFESSCLCFTNSCTVYSFLAI